MPVISQFTDFALRAGDVTPNGNETPTARGDLYVRDGINSTALYINTTGTNTGWAEITGSIGVLHSMYIARTEHPGGNAEAAINLPPRTGGWRLVNAYIRSRGASAGNATLLDLTAGNAMTNAMVPGAANVVTNASSLIQAQEDVPSGNAPVWSGASNPPAFDGFSVWIGL
jgi:hypothetical protein